MRQSVLRTSKVAFLMECQQHVMTGVVLRSDAPQAGVVEHQGVDGLPDTLRLLVVVLVGRRLTDGVQPHLALTVVYVHLGKRLGFIMLTNKQTARQNSGLQLTFLKWNSLSVSSALRSCIFSLTFGFTVLLVRCLDKV